MCGEERPQDYMVPDIYQPDQEEAYRIQQEELAMLQYTQVTKWDAEILSAWTEIAMLASLLKSQLYFYNLKAQCVRF